MTTNSTPEEQFDARVEVLACDLHEAGREAVERGKVVNKIPGQPFLSWKEISEDAREGRRIMARYLLRHYTIEPRCGCALMAE